VVPVRDTNYPDATAVVYGYTPSTVLVEFGFLSHDGDAKYLASKWAKERLVIALMAGAVKAAELYP